MFDVVLSIYQRPHKNSVTSKMDSGQEKKRKDLKREKVEPSTPSPKISAGQDENWADFLLPSDIEHALQKPRLDLKKAETEKTTKAVIKNIPLVTVLSSKEMLVPSPALSTPSSVSYQDLRGDEDHEPLRKSNENYSLQLVEESRVRKDAMIRRLQDENTKNKKGLDEEESWTDIKDDPRQREEYFKRRLYAEYGTTVTVRGKDMIPRERSPIPVSVKGRRKSAKMTRAIIAESRAAKAAEAAADAAFEEEVKERAASMKATTSKDSRKDVRDLGNWGDSSSSGSDDLD